MPIYFIKPLFVVTFNLSIYFIDNTSLWKVTRPLLIYQIFDYFRMSISRSFIFSQGHNYLHCHNYRSMPPRLFQAVMIEHSMIFRWLVLPILRLKRDMLAAQFQTSLPLDSAVRDFKHSFACLALSHSVIFRYSSMLLMRARLYQYDFYGKMGSRHCAAPSPFPFGELSLRHGRSFLAAQINGIPHSACDTGRCIR